MAEQAPIEANDGYEAKVSLIRHRAIQPDDNLLIGG
jgi:hypothetical protein